MNGHSASVVELLTYIQEVEKLKRKPVYVVPTEFFAAHLSSIKGLPEIQANLQDGDDEVWLRVPRLQEVPPPHPPEELAAWITISKSTESVPILKLSLPIYDGKTKVGDELIEDNPELKELFDWYTKFLWAPWSAAERLRRKTITIYNKLFLLHQTMMADAAENPIEFVWGIGVASWKRQGGGKVEHPLLTQLCDIRLNEKSFALDICPRESETKIELDCYVDMEVQGVPALEALWREMQSKQANPVTPFSPETFDGILKSAVAQLDPSGRYEQLTNNLAVPVPTENLVVVDTWVLFARKRSADVFLEDVHRLKKSIEAGAAIPPVIQEFVTEGDTEVRTQAEVPFRGLSTSTSGSGVKELFFPMPYNEEQVSIIRKLEANNGVVVQGPPGTGKTHTIANVICHYLAQGKKVLVTSKGETALAVLQEKLPERIRPLSVALLSDDQNGMRQFEHSIQTIASEVSTLQPARLEANIQACEVLLNELHARIAAVDQAISADAAQNMQKYKFQGQEVTPESLAKLVISQQEDHQWFDDNLPETAGAPPLDDEDARMLREARFKAINDLSYVGFDLPAPELLPTWEQLSVLHKDILRAKTIDAEVQTGSVHALKDASFETFEEARNLLEILTGYLERYSMVSAKANGKSLRNRLREASPDDTLVKSLFVLKAEIQKLDEQRKRLVAHAIELPAEAERNDDFLEALERLVAGKSGFSLPFGKAEARKLIAASAVAGSTPKEKGSWSLVQEAALWRCSAARELARYAALAAEFDLALSPAVALDAATKFSYEQLSFAETVREMVVETEQVLFVRVQRVFGTKAANELGDNYEEPLRQLINSLHAHLDKGRLGYAMNKVAEYVAVLEYKQGDIVSQLRHFLQERIGGKTEREDVLRSDWHMLVAEAKRLITLKPQLDLIGKLCGELSKAGAPKWATRLRSESPTSDFDPILPTMWRDAWAWRQALSLLERIDVHSRIRACFQERRELTTRLSKTYQDLVAEKTWLGVYNNSPPSIRQALQGYLTSIQAMGAGTGIRAMRHRRNAREAMARAYQAVPCWVLPQWRVSETLPPELGLFDLVVVDEASQSDIWALPALMRGKKLLVVGDHKQVSPSIVGMADQKIVDIQRRFLESQPHGRYMTPDASIYDLARVVFAGNSVMLKEHFRCVSAIIEYSNREFYEGAIRPLRVPNADERLDPPLIDVLVQGGHRNGDLNKPEAEAIVQEIEKILQDDTLAKRTIGVVTLLGIEQAKYLTELVANRIAPEDVIARRLTVGPPPQFQGRERDIMLVSMVLQHGDKTAANSLAQQQRFNVALSRARDRTYLFHSVGHESFSGDSLTGRLLKHFRQPFAQDQALLKASRDLCESGFELEMFDELAQRGYRVRPQVPCGGYRIDFVVEGYEGRRLAIECDGDRFHGPGQWEDDMARQRVLERAGWVFWRCFASSFVRRRKEVLDDLWATLSELGIEPMGDDESDSAQWVLSKTVDPMGITQPVLSGGDI